MTMRVAATLILIFGLCGTACSQTISPMPHPTVPHAATPTTTTNDETLSKQTEPQTEERKAFELFDRFFVSNEVADLRKEPSQSCAKEHLFVSALLLTKPELLKEAAADNVQTLPILENKDILVYQHHMALVALSCGLAALRDHDEVLAETYLAMIVPSFYRLDIAEQFNALGEEYEKLEKNYKDYRNMSDQYAKSVDAVIRSLTANSGNIYFPPLPSMPAPPPEIHCTTTGDSLGQYT